MQKTGCFSFILAVVMTFTCLAAASCGGETVSYSTNIAVSDLAAAADKVLPDSEKYTAVPDTYIAGRMKIDTEDFKDYIVKISVIDEYGIFKASSVKEVESTKEAIENYLSLRLDEWMPEYMPEEFPKLENATVKVMGQYVVYGILADDVKSDVFAAIENTLLGK